MIAVVLILIVMCVHSQLTNCTSIEAYIDIASKVLDFVTKLIEKSPSRTSVVVSNQGTHHAMLKYLTIKNFYLNCGLTNANCRCASKNDRIGNPSGEWLDPGKSISWSFTPWRQTQFWCTMYTYGAAPKTGWDVYVQKWKNKKNPTLWTIKNDGVYDGQGQQTKSFAS